VATGSRQAQNLGSAQFIVSFLPRNEAFPYGLINLEGQFSPSYQSYFATLQIGGNF
jgi:hypothetical protein